MNQKFNLKANNFIKNMLRYSYLIIMALLLNAVVNEIIVSANKIICCQAKLLILAVLLRSLYI